MRKPERRKKGRKDSGWQSAIVVETITEEEEESESPYDGPVMVMFPELGQEGDLRSKGEKDKAEGPSDMKATKADDAEVNVEL